MARSRAIDVEGTTVRGVGLDPETRCAHYDSDVDVIAIRFACCGDYYPCLDCHSDRTDHPAEPWPTDQFDTHAVLCGCCGTELTITEYLDTDSRCPSCNAAFNPGCRTHWHHYFAVDPAEPPTETE